MLAAEDDDAALTKLAKDNVGGEGLDAEQGLDIARRDPSGGVEMGEHASSLPPIDPSAPAVTPTRRTLTSAAILDAWVLGLWLTAGACSRRLGA
ncbi:MAG: hypothetical protein ACRDM8_08430 [Gaiellaceae bacterium]